MARGLLRGVGGFVAGAIALGAVTFGMGIALPKIITIPQVEGAHMMHVTFFVTLLGAIVGGFAGAVIALTWRRKS